MAHYPGITDSHTDFALWSHLVIPAKPNEVLLSVSDEKWQELRLYMKGKPLARRLQLLENWLWIHRDREYCGPGGSDLHKAKVQVSNYVLALKRGGMIK